MVSIHRLWKWGVDKYGNREKTISKKAQKDYEYLTGDAATRRLQELREKAILDENSAYETGKLRGKKLGSANREKEIAMAMIKNNINREIIIKCTGLSEKELNKLFLQKV